MSIFQIQDWEKRRRNIAFWSTFMERGGGKSEQYAFMEFRRKGGGGRRREREGSCSFLKFQKGERSSCREIGRGRGGRELLPFQFSTLASRKPITSQKDKVAADKIVFQSRAKAKRFPAKNKIFCGLVLIYSAQARQAGRQTSPFSALLLSFSGILSPPTPTNSLSFFPETNLRRFSLPFLSLSVRKERENRN